MVSSILVSLFAVFIAGVSQIILKKTAVQHSEQGFIKKFLNVGVIVAYTMVLMSSLMNTWALKEMPLKLTTITEATGYIWVPLLSMFFLKIKIKRNTIIGAIIIVFGMVLFALGYQ